uniref:NADH-ubiquinone oxidoreductase chain 2 n=1 Tax=Ochterus marginatus TaxID=280162 RepID=C5HIV2_9HEMI|nr:NADH dehydrogenase subunit 2 [Ochterus marginatus]
MKKNSTKYLFIMILVISTLLTISSSNWLGMWMGLEMNLLSFIPLISKTKSLRSSEANMLYFLIQSMGSVLFLMTILLNMLVMDKFKFMGNIMTFITMSSILLKMGAAPFHMWMPELVEKIEWFSVGMLLTWQKIAPMSILSFLSEKTQFILFIVATSTIFGAIGGLNQTSLRKILAFSSIGHTGWIIACMKFDNEMWIFYLTVYIIMLWMMILMFNYNSMFYLNQLMIVSPQPTEKIMYMIMLLSLGGLPPFLGFLPKWIVIQSMMMKSLYFIMTIMLLSALITLFYYLRIIMPMFLMYNSTSKWMISSKSPLYKTQFTILLINLILPLITILNMF